MWLQQWSAFQQSNRQLLQAFGQRLHETTYRSRNLQQLRRFNPIIVSWAGTEVITPVDTDADYSSEEEEEDDDEENKFKAKVKMEK